MATRVLRMESGTSARMERREPARKACRRCGVHPAVFLRKGEVRRDREHVLCPRCWRSELDRNLARLLLAG